MITRSKVYEKLDDERDYQDNLPPARTEGGPKQVGSYLSLIQHALTEAQRAYYEQRGDEPALHFVRKLTALGVRCLEEHGCPDRTIEGKPCS